MKTIVLDSGHGGCNPEYVTPGKRSPIFEDGSVLYEGECNRQIKARIMELMRFQNMPYFDCSPEQEDISLSERVKRANSISDSLFISLHSNAGGGTGCEVFISKNCSKKSEQMAKIIENLYFPVFEGEKWRGIKREDFFVIKNTYQPAILIESFFMDTEKECKKYLMTRSGRDRIAYWIFEAIKEMVK
jgi:N-acetylmuramoyl-L-alanine amidase|tara:strand:+ start:10754 stop:11317 length:564 start_codon:yes stop_codon:yes gene_type:complete